MIKWMVVIGGSFVVAAAYLGPKRMTQLAYKAGMYAGRGVVYYREGRVALDHAIEQQNLHKVRDEFRTEMSSLVVIADELRKMRVAGPTQIMASTEVIKKEIEKANLSMKLDELTNDLQTLGAIRDQVKDGLPTDTATAASRVIAALKNQIPVTCNK